MFLNIVNVGAERMSSGRLFQATGPATQNARLSTCMRDSVLSSNCVQSLVVFVSLNVIYTLQQYLQLQSLDGDVCSLPPAIGYVCILSKLKFF